MNILMICTEKLPVPNIRGGAIQTYICGVAKLLSRRHRLTILGRTDPALPDEETVDGIRYVRVDSAGLFDVYSQRVIDFLSRNGENYDIIHIFNRPKLVLPVRSVAPSARIILSMHNDMFQPAKIDHAEGKAALEQTETVVTISNYIGAAITAYFPEAAGKLKTIYSGVDLQRFAPWSLSDAAREARESLRRQYGLEKKKVVLFVGRLTRNKGPHVLIRSLGHVRHSDAALVIVGGSWYSDNTVSDYVAYIRALAAKSPLPVITTGYVEAHEVHRWYSAADIFVCPSLWQEPLARVHYEAMAAGLAFVTTNRGGNPEIVTSDNGILVQDPENPQEYAQHLNSLLANLSKCRTMGLHGRRLVEQQFTWERVAHDILKVWENRS
jgi:spore coat protein SA